MYRKPQPMDAQLTAAYLKALFEIRKTKPLWAEQVLQRFCDKAANVSHLLELVEQSRRSDLSKEFVAWRDLSHAFHVRKVTRVQSPARTQQVQVAARRNGRAHRSNNKVG